MATPAFECTQCGLMLDDGVDYSWCPKCSGSVRVIAVARPPKPAVVPSVPRLARLALSALIVVQIVFALLDPDAFGYLRAVLIAGQLLGAAVVLVIALVAPDVRVLARDRRVRVLHGLEHATIKVLESEYGLGDIGGRTYQRSFELEMPQDGEHWDRLTEVRLAAGEAIRRIRHGDRVLAYDPRCGTSWLVARALIAFAVVGVGIAALALGLPIGVEVAATTAIVLAARAAARPLGLAAQRWLTVSTALASAKVGEVTREVFRGRVYVRVVIDVVVADRGVAPIAPGWPG